METTDYKLLVFDLDGTLLYDNILTPRTVRALQAAHEAGYHIVVATGRPMVMVPRAILDLPSLRYLITAGGAVIQDWSTKEVVSSMEIPPQTVRRIVEVGRAGRAAFQFMLPQRCLFEMRGLRLMLDLMKKEGQPRMPKEKKAELLHGTDLVWNAPRCLAKSGAPVMKINCLYGDVKSCQQQLKQFAAIEGIAAVTTLGIDVEMTASEATKGHAVAEVRRRLAIPKAQVMVFGDSGNDVSMRGYAGCFVAMGNASGNVKAVADHVAEPAADDGVAKALYELLHLPREGEAQCS